MTYLSLTSSFLNVHSVSPYKYPILSHPASHPSISQEVSKQEDVELLAGWKWSVLRPHHVC